MTLARLCSPSVSQVSSPSVRLPPPDHIDLERALVLVYFPIDLSLSFHGDTKGKVLCETCQKKCKGNVLRVGKLYFHIDCFKCRGKLSVEVAARIGLTDRPVPLRSMQTVNRRWRRAVSSVTRPTTMRATTAPSATNICTDPSVPRATNLSRAK